MRIRVIKKSDYSKELLDDLKKLTKSSVQVGHFKEQGNHYSGFTYPELMELHHNGSNLEEGPPLPPRPVLDILFQKNRNLPLNKITNKQRKNKFIPILSNKRLLEDIGKDLENKEKNIFGSSFLAKNSEVTISIKGKNSPLIDTGDLKDKVTHKISGALRNNT